MAEDKGNTAVPQHGDRDRVAMLSLKADGTPDQHNPEIVGEREFALEATKEQFKQQAVSAVDQEKRAELFGTGGGGEQLEQDPKIAELKDAHDAAADAAESAAESTVGALFTDEDKGPAGSPPKPSSSGSAAAGKATTASK